MKAKLKLVVFFLFFTLTIKATIYEKIITNCNIISNVCVGDTIRFIGDSTNANFYGASIVSVYNQISQTSSYYTIVSYYGTATIQDHVLALGDVFFETQPCPNPSGFYNIFYNCTVSINDKWEHQNQIKMYPNPTNGELTLELPNQPSEWLTTILDVQGRTVLEKSFNSNKINLKLTLDNGIYLVRVTNKDTNETVIKKLVVSD